MTLIVGVKCKEGIVVGADSITTFGSAIEQEVQNKIKLIEPDGIFAGAGAVGLNQLIEQRISSNWTSLGDVENLADLRGLISELMWTEVGSALERVRDADGVFGTGLAEAIRCNLMIALPHRDTPTLLVYDEVANSIEVTFEAPFFSLGSGGFQADPFLAFVKRIFWDDAAPKTIAAGLFCVLWTLDHVSRVNAGLGVGGRPNVAVLRRNDSTWTAERLNDDYLFEQMQAIPVVEDRLRSFRDRLEP